MAQIHRGFLICLAVLLTFTGCSSTKSGQKTTGDRMPRSDAGVGDGDIVSILSPIRAKHDVPAMAAAVVTSRGLTKAGAVGTRKWGTDTPVSLDDLWHLGSDTKVMTSTMTALLVEQGKLKWTTTVSEVFPDLSGSFSPEARGITVLQLLSHAAGVPANMDFDTLRTSSPVRQQRIEVVQKTLGSRLSSTPGTQFLYSNLGYIIVGAMIERILDMDWEMAIRQYIFRPLGMSSAGFGGLGTEGLIDQPWGHEAPKKPIEKNGPNADNPPVMGPAGRVHCTIQDWALFIADQLRGARGKRGLLEPEDYQMLQTPHFGGVYALGWGVVQKDWAGGKALTHAGSNNWYLAKVWIAPEKDFAILLCTNEGQDSSAAADEAIAQIIPLAATADK